MALASAAAEDAAISGITALAAYYSIHTATTGTSGTSEVTGGSYARQAVTWATASAGTADSSDALSFPIPASTTCAYSGTESAVTAGTFYIGAQLSSSITFSSAGTLSIASGAASISAS